MTTESSRLVRILVVCTGNICRSAFAERYLQSRFDALQPGLFDVRSAGTGRVAGLPVPPHVHVIAGRHGADMTGYASRMIAPEIIQQADLVLTATAAHQVQVLREVPAALKRCFTITEFARGLDADDHPGGDRDAWVALVRTVALRRPIEGATDIDDPFGRPLEAYGAMAEQVLPSLDRIAAAAR